jgi:[protein-PII] uridylyltransferase
MEKGESLANQSLPEPWLAGHRLIYDDQMRSMRATFEAHAQHLHAGAAAIQARSAAVDSLIQAAWAEVMPGESAAGIALVAVGGYGRQELFPFSDVDLMFLLDSRVAERSVKDPIRSLNQLLWDTGLRVSAMTRKLSECERFDRENVEFTLALLDARHVAGDSALTERLTGRVLPRLIAREAKKIAARVLEVSRLRHARFGETLFHLEPNIKECPGGLRDAHVCEWMARLGQAEGEGAGEPRDESAFREAREFLLLVRTFLHLRHGRDDNTLDWQAQDAAAEISLGASRSPSQMDAAFWMRQYFRRARILERSLRRFLEQPEPQRPSRVRSLLATAGKASPAETDAGFAIQQNRIAFTPWVGEPAHDPEVVLAIFAAMAATGAGLSQDTERSIEQSLPILSAHLEDGPDLWLRLQAILSGSFAGMALRSMHTLGILELVIPEFHGIDALVIRDAYHRYTVDEHTFVLIDTLHGLGAGARSKSAPGVWAAKFGQLFHDLPHPELLLLASLLHDTGKGHAATDHPSESARMAANLMRRLELDVYETSLVLELIVNHLEMSAALRRDVFDLETIRSFSARVASPESLRMLTLFTYADIAAVHPDALTSWKAENLWRLYQATAAFLDRNVDDERVAAEGNQPDERVHRIQALLPNETRDVNCYLEGFPQRYLQTRTPELVRAHFQMASRLKNDPARIELDFRYAPGVSELTLITTDRPRLFASVAGALASWGMNIITADAFSNRQGIVVDSFRFADTFRTLEMNDSERERFRESVCDVILGNADLEALLASRRRGRRKAAKIQVAARVDFDDSASSHSTLLQVVAQDTPGLLRALSLTLAEHGCNIEVALVDTEGETAIDVFYVTLEGGKLSASHQDALRTALLEAIERNAG